MVVAIVVVVIWSIINKLVVRVLTHFLLVFALSTLYVCPNLELCYKDRVALEWFHLCNNLNIGNSYCLSGCASSVIWEQAFNGINKIPSKRWTREPTNFVTTLCAFAPPSAYSRVARLNQIG